MFRSVGCWGGGGGGSGTGSGSGHGCGDGCFRESTEEEDTLLRATGPECAQRVRRQRGHGGSGSTGSRHKKGVWRCIFVGMLVAALVGGVDAVGQDELARELMPSVPHAVGTTVVGAFALLAQDRWRRTGMTEGPRGEYTEDCATSQDEGSEAEGAQLRSDAEAQCVGYDTSATSDEEDDATERFYSYSYTLMRLPWTRFGRASPGSTHHGDSFLLGVSLSESPEQ